MAKRDMRRMILVSVGYICLLAVLVKSVAGLFDSPGGGDWDAYHEHMMTKVSCVVALIAIVFYTINILINRRYPEYRLFRKYYVIHWLVFFVVSVFIVSSIAFFFYYRVKAASALCGADIMFIVVFLILLTAAIFLIAKRAERLSNNIWLYHISVILKYLMFYVIAMAVIGGITY
ncbi:MAG TPA: hypothetical protein PKK43_00445 [Spirochaetota bacterium]|nr:hypothetical protein [Spirochaetota bacterium]